MSPEEHGGFIAMKFLSLAFKILLALLLSYLLTALLLSALHTHPQIPACEEKQPAYVTTNGVHLFLVLPLEALADTLRRALPVPPGARFAYFGWGEREFYRSTPTWGDLKLCTAFRALFLKTPAAMHVSFSREPYTGWRRVELCPGQYEALNTYLNDSFRRDSSARLLPVEAAGYPPGDCFFEAYGEYTSFRTCNVWVNDALKAAGEPTALWAPFDFGVLWHLE